MDNIRTKEELINELQDKEIRDSYVSDHISIGIPLQIRALRLQKGREWTQKELADLAGMKQERISAIENPNYKNAFTLSTLLRIASAFDVALIVRFAPISELVKWELSLSPEKLEATSFDEDPYFKPESITVPAHSGLAVGSSISLQCLGAQKESLAEKKGKLFVIEGKQKRTENMIWSYAKEIENQKRKAMGA
jgi:transcriptional regulator with XRE-family HTH domain